MKNIILVIIAIIPFISFSQENPNYNDSLATSLGADDYGMKSYVLVLLKTGSNSSTDIEERKKSFQGHMANIGKMVKANQLVIAGPMGKNDDSIRGIFILNTSTVEEAREILKSDPAISANYLEAVFYPWYGSAALSTYLPFSDQVWKKQP
ncbi:Uncharacterized conserved protein YciI, contains a putative active-site phosphohistidine [Spirosomataceae bacterium TFI 002]|nr:Uncharacterized conserved protein YciI, contains a putative active-site phosphohistidine [Spirosomataceae bacterium TFI 002]